MSICVVCDKDRPFADATRGWICDPLIGAICPECHKILDGPTVCDGGVVMPPVNQQLRLRAFEYSGIVAQMTAMARDVVQYSKGK